MQRGAPCRSMSFNWCEGLMTSTASYSEKTFVVADNDARVRDPDNLMEFKRYAPGDPLPPNEQIGGLVRIPAGTKVRVDQIKIVPTGSSRSITFAHAISIGIATNHGWTSARNFDGEFRNETTGTAEPQAGAGKYSANAAWKGGTYLGQLTLVSIVGADGQIKHISLDTLDPYFGLIEAAGNDKILVAINSGFRSYQEQKYLYEGYVNGRPGFNKAAPPGRSNHQNGVAFDIAVAGAAGNPLYDWLKTNATAYGFIRTVSGEPWHWEYDPVRAT